MRNAIYAQLSDAKLVDIVKQSERFVDPTQWINGEVPAHVVTSRRRALEELEYRRVNGLT